MIENGHSTGYLLAAGVLASAFLSSQIAIAAVSARDIDDMITHDGAAATLRQLTHASGDQPGSTDFDAVLDQVSHGSQPWLRIAARLYPATDGGNHYSLLTAVSMAIQSDPDGVLRMVDGPFRLDDVCKERAIEPTRDAVEVFVHRTRAALATVHDARLLSRRDDCLKLLS